MKMTAKVSKLVRQALLVAPLALVPSASSLVLQTLGFDALASGSVMAQEQQEKPQYKTKKTFSLRQPVYKDFAKIQEKTDAEDWRGALVVLKGLEQSKAPDYTSYEKANLWNYFGWIYYSLENYDNAIRYYQKVLKEEELSDALQLGTLKTLAQLMFVKEDYASAVKILREYIDVNPIVGADDYVLLASGCYQLGDMKCALENVDIAVSKFEKAGKVPKENWYTLQRAVYYDKGDNAEVVNILIKLIRHYPKASYWKQLSGMYGAMGQERNQLYAMETAYLMGALDKDTELMNMAYLFMGADVPYKAVKVIRKGIKDKLIPETSKNLETLATALRLAQHVKEAIPEMEKAAEKSEKGDLFARLAGVYLDTDRNKAALSAGQEALKRGGIKRIDQLHIVLGMANMNLENYEAAIKEFDLAAKDKNSKRAAEQWREYAKSELERKKSLNL